MKDPSRHQDFLTFYHQNDSNPFVCGMGKNSLYA